MIVAFGARMRPSYRINFTKTTLLQITIPTKGTRDYYYDLKEKNLILDVTSKGTKSFYLYKRINGKPERIFLGLFPDISVEQARKLASQIKGEIAFGINPKDKINAKKAEITFGEMFLGFMERYSKKHKRSWQYDEREVNKFLPHWFKRKASSITKHEVQLLHEEIREENGLYQANRILERIRAIYNKNIEWGWNGINPANGIKKYKEKSRDRFIQPDELPRFFQALQEEHNITARDYIWISLLTGARKSNVLSMKWEDISFARKEWRIPDTKNGEAVTIALSDKAIEILDERRKFTNGPYVFASEQGSKGYLQDPKKAWARILKKAEIEDLRLHDLRRTLGSYQVITGSSLAIIGKSLGHKSSKATEVYARLNLDPVRESVERATEAMFAFIKNNNPDNV
jgi:integrase